MAETPLAHGPTLAASHHAQTEPRAEASGDRLAAGARAGEYEVERFLGAGAMGEVYAGRHPVINKRVAIKVLRHALTASPEAAERFIREARAVNQVDHPNVVDVFAFGRLDDGRLYLVMDLIDGRSLRQVVQDGPLPIATTLDVLDQIAGALDAAHARGVVHRDLKPDNVMLAGEPPKAFVLDFGIAKLVATGGTLSGNGTLTGQGTWLGTPGYMAPEQWSSDGAGPASDRYALGVMAFEMLSGKLPFQAPTLPQMMEQHFRTPVPALSTRGTVSYPSTVDPVLARAMAKDPTKRFASARELVDALRLATRGKRVAGAVAKRSWVPAIAGTGVLAVAVVAIVVTRDGDPATATASNAGAGSGDPIAAPSVPGQVFLEIITVPPKASVYRGEQLHGTTPAKLPVIPGEQLEMIVRKPGYQPVALSLLAPSKDHRHPVVELVQTNGFEGMWRLQDGELRKFKRVDDHVDAYKLATVTDEPVFYQRFEFVDKPGIVFSTLAKMSKGNHPSCQLTYRVDLHYMPQPESLELHREMVLVRKQPDGSCVQLRREQDDPQKLQRVHLETSGTDGEWTHAPVGKPAPVIPQKIPPKNLPRPKLPPKDEKSGLALPKEPKNLNAPAQQQRPTPQQAIVPQAPAPTNNDVGDMQAPRGDSQVAPPPRNSDKGAQQKN